jgi:hypothetical protein
MPYRSGWVFNRYNKPTIVKEVDAFSLNPLQYGDGLVHGLVRKWFYVPSLRTFPICAPSKTAAGSE